MNLQVSEITLSSSPERPGHVRAAATVGPGGCSGEEIWFDVPDRFSEELVTEADPWLVLLLPLAAVTGSDLVLPGAVDIRLAENARELLRIWDCWYSWTQRVRLHAESRDPGAAGAGDRTVAFFSGGVDSFYTVLRHEHGITDRANQEAVDDLLTVCGFDIPVARPGACENVFTATRDVAKALGKDPVTIYTNLRDTAWDDRVPWEKLGFGPALAACAHLLGRRFDRALVPSGTGYHRMSPRGGHPLTTPLLSSGSLALVQDGAAASRVEKTREVARSDLGRAHLRVCWRSGTDRNCSNCEKCYRTMLTLQLLGESHRCPGFRWEGFRLDDVPRMLARKESDLVFLEEIEELAVENGDAEVAERVRQAVRRSRFNRLLLRFAGRMREHRGAWRLGRWLRRRILDRSIV